MATWVKTLYYKVYVTIRTHTYISLWYEPKFNWLQRLYKTPIFISLILSPVKMLSLLYLKIVTRFSPSWPLFSFSVGPVDPSAWTPGKNTGCDLL